MEKNTKHRILGVLVVVALVIISLPFFQNEKESSTQTALVKAPPFPDQTVQVSAGTPVDATAKTIPPTNIVAAQTPPDNDDQPDDVIRTTHLSNVNTQEPALIKQSVDKAITIAANEKFNHSAASAHITDEGTQKIKLNEIPPAINAGAPQDTKVESVQAALQNTSTKLAAKTVTALTATKFNLQDSAKKTLQALNIRKLPHTAKRPHEVKLTTQTAVNDDGLFSLQNAAYVIQIGSFKNKTNALRLVNQLRANGYPAFIQKISTTFGENTRVFVGPEGKRASARALADKLESNMHLRGIVVSYQPLTL